MKTPTQVSDHFGIGQALRGATNVYFMSSRATGRTTSLVNSVKDGDRVYFKTPGEKDRVQRMMTERGVKVDCRVLDVRDFHWAIERGPCTGRTIFDHSWVEEFFLNRLDQAIEELGYLQERLSNAPPPPETSRARLERDKWPFQYRE